MDWTRFETWNGFDSDHLEQMFGLPTFLTRSGKGGRLKNLLADFGFLQAKLAKRGAEALLRDFSLAKGPSLAPIRTALRLAAPVLSEEPLELPSQLLARLAFVEADPVPALLDQAKRADFAPFLVPLTPCLAGPNQPLLATLRGHQAQVNAVAASPDSRQVVSGSSDHTLRVWDIENGVAVRTMKGHTEPIYGVALSPDGTLALSASEDRTIKVWEVETGALPDNVKLVAEGRLQFQQGHYGLAIDAFSKSIERDALNSQAWVGLAAAYDQTGRFDQADRSR